MPGAGQAMSVKGARVGLLGVRIVGIGDRQAGQGVRGCEGNDVRHDPGTHLTLETLCRGG